VESFIEECLSSVYSQTYQQIEVICVDNNSQDATLNKLNDLKIITYPNLIILQEMKPGACAARNKGLSIAKGEWIQFLDADDSILPSKLTHQLNLILKSSIEPHFIAGAANFKKLDSSEPELKIPDSRSNYLAVFIGKLGNTCANLWQKKALQLAGAWNEDLSSSQETDLMFRLISQHNDVLIDVAPLTIINQRESGQISQSNPVKRWVNYVEVRIAMIEKIKKLNPSDFNGLQAEYETYLLSSILILNKYNHPKALQFTTTYQFNFKLLMPKYGIGKKILLSFKLLGAKRTLYLFSKK